MVPKLQPKRTCSHAPLKISQRAPPDNAESPAIRGATRFGWQKKSSPEAPDSVSGGGHATAIATGIDYQEGQNALTHDGELQPLVREQEVQAVAVNVMVDIEVALGLRRILDAARPVIGARSDGARIGIENRFTVPRNGPSAPHATRSAASAIRQPPPSIPWSARRKKVTITVENGCPRVA
jgi:hypothetical protein